MVPDAPSVFPPARPVVSLLDVEPEKGQVGRVLVRSTLGQTIPSRMSRRRRVERPAVEARQVIPLRSTCSELESLSAGPRAHLCSRQDSSRRLFFFLSWDIHFDARGDGFAFKCNRLFFFFLFVCFFFCLRLAFLWVSNQYVNIDAVPHLVRRPGAVTEG